MPFPQFLPGLLEAEQWPESPDQTTTWSILLSATHRYPQNPTLGYMNLGLLAAAQHEATLSTEGVGLGRANAEMKSLNVKALAPLQPHMVLREVMRKKGERGAESVIGNWKGHSHLGVSTVGVGESLFRLGLNQDTT